jgi:hypothetical protein
VTEQKITFNFYGTRLDVILSDPLPVQQTLEAYSYFRCESAGEAAVRISVSQSRHKPAGRLPVFSFRKAKSYGFSKRVVYYPEGSSVLIQKNKNAVEAAIYSENADYLNEFLFVTISSLVGWKLESEGWVRLHAMSFIKNNGAVSLIGDPGSGKSTAAVKHLQAGNKIFSDEITLIAPNGSVYPWPIPVHISQKTAEELKIGMHLLRPFKKRVHATKFQFALSETNLAPPAPLTSVRTPHSALGVLLRISAGSGLPQILEYQLRFDNLGSIIRIVLRRFQFGAHLLLTGKITSSVPHEIQN